MMSCVGVLRCCGVVWSVVLCLVVCCYEFSVYCVVVVCVAVC